MYCNKIQSYKNNLTNQLRVHTGKKPFVCTVCGYTSASSDNFSEHMRKHIVVYPYYGQTARDEGWTNTYRNGLMTSDVQQLTTAHSGRSTSGKLEYPIGVPADYMNYNNAGSVFRAQLTFVVFKETKRRVLVYVSDIYWMSYRRDDK
jgi:hypothetical protein